MEIMQSVLPWREFSLSDIVSNLTGAIFFSILYILGHHFWKKF
jgi:VanZ family protein